MLLDNINIKTFNKWAIAGKDKGMEEGHSNSVNKMIDIIEHQTTIKKIPFKFLDLGCGNGWVVRKFLDYKNCKYTLGVDGAPAMIEKAKKLDKIGNYLNIDIETWKYDKKFDIIFSMETFYYFNNPSELLKNIYKQYLHNNGFIIIGIDHYLENESTLSWEKEFDLSINTLSIEGWVTLFKNSGFNNVKSIIYGKKKSWNGTLILYASKDNF